MRNQTRESYFQFFQLNAVERAELIGTTMSFNEIDYLIVNLDEFTSQMYYNDSITVLGVFQNRSDLDATPGLSVLLPSIDDCAMRADFHTNVNINLSTLTQYIHRWAKRSNYRHINVHALEDYCRFLGACRIDYY